MPRSRHPENQGEMMFIALTPDTLALVAKTLHDLQTSGETTEEFTFGERQGTAYVSLDPKELTAPQLVKTDFGNCYVSLWRKD